MRSFNSYDFIVKEGSALLLKPRNFPSRLIPRTEGTFGPLILTVLMLLVLVKAL